MIYLMIRLRNYLNNLEYHVFCEQPLFQADTKGVFHTMEEHFNEMEKEFEKRSKERAKER